MNPGYPDVDDFNSNMVQEKSDHWSFHRDAGRGGQNYGEDYFIPDGSVLVGYETSETSSRHAGNPDIRILTKGSGVFNIPNGVHIGNRLDPGGIPGGPGAAYSGDLKMAFVSQTDWFEKAKEGH